MRNIALIHKKLTSNSPTGDLKGEMLNFAKELGWNPSYYLNPVEEEPANGYLVIEHGLENAAIISFLNKSCDELSYTEEKSLLNLSYNNLVNWHIAIDSRYVTYFYILNNTNKRFVEKVKIIPEDEQRALRMEMFEQVILKKPNPNIKPLDDVLIDTISKWKLWISSDLNNDVSTLSLSTLFNSIILIRSIEDNHKRIGHLQRNNKILLEIFDNNYTDNNFSIVVLLEKAQEYLHVDIPQYLLNLEELNVFSSLDKSQVRRLINDFYENDYNYFSYDFSIMTKQALSRIYEKYVAILKVSNIEESQLNLGFSTQLAEESINKQSGSFYTPEYIARFFAKYLQRNIPFTQFKNLKVIEPAVGSGIFLRTLIETQVENNIPNFDINELKDIFSNIKGIDIDPNATLATKLSLSLLYYICFNSFPESLNIETGDSLDLLDNYKEQADIIISNPPYIKADGMSVESKNQIKNILGELNIGKPDIYLAFLKLSIDALKPNGYGLFVLPYSFLNAKNAGKLRNYLLKNCQVKLIADLSRINVFDNVGVYSVLLIFQKKSVNISDNISWIVRCRSSVGETLQSVLKENEVETSKYQTYKVKDYFKDKTDEWFVLSKKEIQISEKLLSFEPISKFLDIKQGIITGNDAIFIRNKKDIPKQELNLYKPYLSDKDMKPYSTSLNIEKVIFYPFKNGEKLTLDELILEYPKTWEYLCSKESILRNNSTEDNWWMLHRSRQPDEILSPKILIPYLVISPKFLLDKEGTLLVSRSSYMKLNKDYQDIDILYYFIGILNTIPCFWYLSTHSGKLASGFSILNVMMLKNIPVPDPSTNTTLTYKMIQLVKQRIHSKESQQFEIENQIQKLAYLLYNLTEEEISFFENNYGN